MLGLGQARGCPVVFPNPDGTFDAKDRAHLLYLYAGTAFEEPGGTIGLGSQNYLFRRRRAGAG